MGPGLGTEELTSLWSKFQGQQNLLGMSKKGIGCLLEIVNLKNTSYKDKGN